jgi:hypothetical protein
MSGTFSTARIRSGRLPDGRLLLRSAEPPPRQVVARG